MMIKPGVSRRPGSISEIVRRSQRLLSTLVFAIGVVAMSPLLAQERATTAMLHLSDGGYLAGSLENSDDPAAIRWRSPQFLSPFSIPLGAVRAVQYPQPDESVQPKGEYCFELVGDDVLYGDLLAATATDFEVESALAGRLQIGRSSVRKFYRWQGENLIYLGPAGLEEWVQSSPAWRNLAGAPATSKPNTSIFGNFGIPQRAMIEFDIAWDRAPDFVFSLGVDRELATDDEAFRFEVWAEQLVAIGEAKREADVASVMRIPDGPGHLHMRAYLDQQERRLLLFTPNGESVASLRLKTGKPLRRGGVRLTNKKGSIRLEAMRISMWDGVAPGKVEADRARVHRVDGSIAYGELASFDAAAKTFVVRAGEEELRIPAAEVTDVFLPADIEDAERREGAEDGRIRVSYFDGSRLTGTATKIEAGSVTLTSSAITPAMRLPVEDRRSLVTLSSTKAKPKPGAGRRGRLEADGVRLTGYLTDSAESSTGGCLVWQPELASGASPIKPGTAGKIIYRDPPTPKKIRSVQLEKLQRERRLGFNVGFREEMKKIVRSRIAKPTSGKQPYLHLRSGDTIPIEVTKITAEGVAFQTPLSDTTFVRHDEVKAIELGAPRGLLSLEDPARTQLLTLPRLQQESPPKHLICSRDADFLRGRIVEMDEENLKFEVRLTTRTIPRNRIAHIIWFHGDELDELADAAPADLPSDVTRVQVVRANGNRLTFNAESFSDQTLFGKSEILGACKTNLKDVDQLLFGASIEEAAADLVFHRWRLTKAQDPKFVEAEQASAPAPTGTSSPLVGQPAPDFVVEKLDGRNYRLSQQKGRIVVLDFWATWCGPCLKTMPLIDRVVEEYAEQGVELLAVNLEEQPRQIESMLERHDLSMEVGLDRDGVVAAKYEVTAIPQTVVIDQAGRVARLFVGGGEKLEEPLRAAIQELLESGDET